MTTTPSEVRFLEQRKNKRQNEIQRIFDLDIVLLAETISVKSLDILNYICKSVEATKHECGRPTGGLTIAVHQRFMNKCDIVSKSEFSISFRLVNTPLFFNMVYFNPDIKEDDFLH